MYGIQTQVIENSHPSQRFGWESLNRFAKTHNIPFDIVQEAIDRGELDGMKIAKIPHDPSECCQACGSYSHNTWACRIEH